MRREAVPAGLDALAAEMGASRIADALRAEATTLRLLTPIADRASAFATDTSLRALARVMSDAHGWSQSHHRARALSLAWRCSAAVTRAISLCCLLVCGVADRDTLRRRAAIDTSAIAYALAISPPPVGQGAQVAS